MITEVLIIGYPDHWCILICVNEYYLNFSINLN